MTTPLVMTFIGRDRPGLVNAISRKIAENDGAWLESRLAQLAGQFAGIVRVEAPEARIADLTAALRELEGQGLRVAVERGLAPRDESAGASLDIELIGLDRPGIVRDVTETLTQLGVNIEEFESGLESAAFTGAPMFRASARLLAPEGLAIEELRKALERLAGELMADISVNERKASEPAPRA
jgi:glycine cleavage system regulatory protein